MPGGDRTGPMGEGQKTGRAAGFCTGHRMPGYMNPGVNNYQGGVFRGAGRGGMPWGGGRGRTWGGGRGFYAQQFPYQNPECTTLPEEQLPQEISREDEISQLKEQAKIMTMTLKGIEKKLDAISKVEEKQE